MLSSQHLKIIFIYNIAGMCFSMEKHVLNICINKKKILNKTTKKCLLKLFIFKYVYFQPILKIL